MIEFKEVTASWQPPSKEIGELFTGEEIDSDDDNSILSKVSFKLSKGDKVAVIGSVGSGKSSLLMAILGEMPIQQGTVLTKKSIEIVLAE